MEYTTPPSYGSTVVNVGGLVTDNEIIFAGSSNKAEQTSTRPDEDVGWSEPVAAHYHLEGTTKEGKKAVVDLQGDLGSRLDRVDVMAEVPNFVKQIVAGAAGTKPYIYQVSTKELSTGLGVLKQKQFGPNLPIIITIDGEEMREEGRLFAEATFIS